MSHDFIDAKKLAARISEVREELAKLLHLQSFLGSPARSGAQGDKSDSPKGKRGKRGKVKQTVLAYLEKRKEGGKARVIAKESGLKLGSINQVLFALKRDGTVTQDKKRGSPFVLAKK